ncbi:uncharacterized protein JCM15063_003095 [Sporobolomyces koalae]|uniref:uncharacterized protein n=1 Tax=Sporobolomyces koalae TaxID=500713 RepID=UPI003171FD89
MPSLFRKLLTPKQSTADLKRAAKVRGPSAISRWTSRNKNGTSCSLPSELVLRILEEAWDADPSTAAVSSLLCKSILERTRRFLYTCPTLRSVGQINLFLRTLKKQPALASRVEAVVLNGRSAGVNSLGGGERMRGAVTTRLPQLLELCSNLRALTIKDAIVFSLTDFSHSDSLLHLTLDGSLLSDRTTTQRYQKLYTPLKNLVTLTLRSAEFDLSTADHFLSPRTLPALAALELEGCRLVDNPSSLTDLGVYEPRRLAASLDLLVLKVAKNTYPTAEQLAEIAGIVETCSKLRALDIEIAFLTSQLVEAIPSGLTHLALLVAPSPAPDLFQPNLDAAQALSASFQSLAMASFSPSSGTPFGTASPSNRSPYSLASVASTPVALTPFGSPGLAHSSGSPKHALSELTHLRLPRCWEPDVPYGWREADLTWAVTRMVRECKKRQIVVGYAPRQERKKGRIVRGQELRDELELVRNSTHGAVPVDNVALY